MGASAAVPTPSARRSASNRGFVWVVGISLLIHGTIISGVVLAQHLRPRPKPINAVPVQLVKLGKPRDPKLLPRRTKPAPPPPPATEGVALDRGDKAKKPERRKPQPRRRREMSDAARRLLESTDTRLDSALDKIDEEAEGDPSGSIYGTTTDATNAASGYVAQITAALKSRYQLPETIPAAQRQFLNARVVLFIERNGRVTRYEFIEKHSNKLFIAALEKLLKTIELPPPPKSIAADLREAGIEVVFKP